MLIDNIALSKEESAEYSRIVIESMVTDEDNHGNDNQLDELIRKLENK